jgi:polyhydroxyalkanoate synthase
VNPAFDLVKQAYLLLAESVQASVRDTGGLDAHTAQKLQFYTRQLVDALAPTNFALSNPQVLRRTLETSGRNLLQGCSNLLDDLQRGRGHLRVRMTDAEEFELGVNVAVTAGKVVFQNALMQLIQYAPATKTVFRRPLLIIPPWINKFYILDLRPRNSFIRWAVEQGHTVFVISWVNPDERLAQKSFEDYMREGLLAALDAMERATGEREANVIGYCLGGTLLAATLAYMTAKRDRRIKSATFFVTMVDFAEAGELSVFIDEEQLHALEERMEKKGYLEARDMHTTFNMLRANDLIWSFVVNNYLLGKSPFPFDLLYWNADSTRMPAAMQSFYLRKMYQENLLAQPGGITLGGVPIDLRRIRTPSYISRRARITSSVALTYGCGSLPGPCASCSANQPHRGRDQSARRQVRSLVSAERQICPKNGWRAPNARGVVVARLAAVDRALATVAAASPRAPRATVCETDRDALEATSPRVA